MAKKWKAEYSINVQKAFKQVFPNPKMRDKLRPLLNDLNVKREIGSRAIERIIFRTEKKGIDKNGNKFADYSKRYKESLQFKVYGKTKKVNLKLTGEMLASMVAVNQSRDKIKITFVDDENNAKAHGHINGGKFRKGKAKNFPQRDFLGLPDEDINKIVKDVIKSSTAGLSALQISIPLASGIGDTDNQLTNLTNVLALGLGF